MAGELAPWILAVTAVALLGMFLISLDNYLASRRGGREAPGGHEAQDLEWLTERPVDKWWTSNAAPETPLEQLVRFEDQGEITIVDDGRSA